MNEYGRRMKKSMDKEIGKQKERERERKIGKTKLMIFNVG